jgi:small subunit ribosomal protein S16
MLRIRLRRVGAKKQPSYRIVVADSQAPAKGRFVEIVGFYNPRTDPPTVELKPDRIQHWLGVGAQPSDAVRRLLEKEGLLPPQPRGAAGEGTAPEAEGAES